MRPLRFRPAGVLMALLGVLALGGHPSLGSTMAQANADLPDDTKGVALVQHVLDQGVVPGTPNKVRYGALAKDRAALDKALAYIAEMDPNLLPTDGDRLAFWINAYNLSMIDAILQNWGGQRSYSVSKDGFSIFDKATHSVAGATYSLNEIEHGVIRGDFGKVSAASRGAAKAAHGAIWGGKPVDARVHMALNCASVGCPELRSKAYQGSSLNKSLNQQSRSYVKDPARGAGPEGISEIFKWYEGDFKSVGGPEGFIKGHRGSAEGVNLGASIPYDWTLNVK